MGNDTNTKQETRFRAYYTQDDKINVFKSCDVILSKAQGEFFTAKRLAKKVGVHGGTFTQWINDIGKGGILYERCHSLQLNYFLHWANIYKSDDLTVHKKHEISYQRKRLNDLIKQVNDLALKHDVDLNNLSKVPFKMLKDKLEKLAQEIHQKNQPSDEYLTSLKKRSTFLVERSNRDAVMSYLFFAENKFIAFLYHSHSHYASKLSDMHKECFFQHTAVIFIKLRILKDSLNSKQEAIESQINLKGNLDDIERLLQENLRIHGKHKTIENRPLKSTVRTWILTDYAQDNYKQNTWSRQAQRKRKICILEHVLDQLKTNKNHTLRELTNFINSIVKPPIAETTLGDWIKGLKRKIKSMNSSFQACLNLKLDNENFQGWLKDTLGEIKNINSLLDKLKSQKSKNYEQYPDYFFNKNNTESSPDPDYMDQSELADLNKNPIASR